MLSVRSAIVCGEDGVVKSGEQRGRARKGEVTSFFLCSVRRQAAVRTLP